MTCVDLLHVWKPSIKSFDFLFSVENLLSNVNIVDVNGIIIYRMPV